MPTRFLIAAIVLGLAAAVRAAPSGGADTPDPARTQRMLKLLAGVASEYREAFDDQGAVVRPIDLEETGLLLGRGARPERARCGRPTAGWRT